MEAGEEDAVTTVMQGEITKYIEEFDQHGERGSYSYYRESSVRMKREP